MPVISFVQARAILSAVEASLPNVRILADLGLTPVVVDINHKFKEVSFSGVKVSFSALEEIAANDTICYSVEGNKPPQKLKLFSADTNLFYKLVPSEDAPTLEISGIRMHRTQERTPWQDTLDKVSSIAPLRGRVLDTCCCLGYTAIAAARQQDVVQVFTFERDTNVLEMADYNPWSRELYLNRKIKLSVGDVFRGVESFSAAFFDAIIHDPPRFALSPELYSFDFYRQLFRVLKPGGRLFHYTGSPGEKQGKDFVKGVLHRLKDAGFVKVVHNPDILGVTACR